MQFFTFFYTFGELIFGPIDLWSVDKMLLYEPNEVFTLYFAGPMFGNYIFLYVFLKDFGKLNYLLLALGV